MVVLPLVKLAASVAQNLGIGASITGMASLRSSVLQRMFGAVQVRFS